MSAAETDSKNRLVETACESSLAESMERMLFSWVQMNSCFYRSMMSYNLEAVKFAKHRIEEDIRTAERLAGCLSFSELNDETVEFCSKAVDEYSTEAATLTNLGVGLVSGSTGEFGKEAANSASEAA